MKAAACLLVGAAAGALATPAAARRVDLRIDRIESPIGVAQDLRASVDGDAAGAELTLRPAPRSGVAADDIAVACRLARDASGWRCAGAATAPAVTADRVGLVVELGGGVAALRLSLGESELRIQSAWSQPFQGLSGHARLRLAELQDGFGRHWPGLILKQGRIDLDLRFDARAASAPQVAADLKLQDVAAESRDGSLALAGNATGRDAPVVARERGIAVDETRQTQRGAYETYIRLTVKTEHLERSVAGTVFSDGKARLIQIKGIDMEAEFGPHMLYVTNEDKPADLTVKVTRADLEALGKGKLNPMTAVIGGRLQLSDMSLAMSLQPQMQALFARFA